MFDLLYLPEWLRRGLLRAWLALSAAWSALVVEASLAGSAGWRIDLPFLGVRYWDVQDRILAGLAPWLLTVIGFVGWWAYLGILANRQEAERHRSRRPYGW